MPIKLAMTECHQNSCVDILAKLGAKHLESLVMIYQPLSCLSLALLADATRMSFIRT